MVVLNATPTIGLSFDIVTLVAASVSAAMTALTGNTKLNTIIKTNAVNNIQVYLKFFIAFPSLPLNKIKFTKNIMFKDFKMPGNQYICRSHPL
jgi:hypothetical protein